MSRRKIIRNMFRAEGERKGVKPSRYMSREFDRYQRDKYSPIVRAINRCKATHKRSTWRARINVAPN